MSIKAMALILISIIAVLLLLVELGATQGTDWSETSTAFASVSVLILFFALVVGVIVKR